MGLLTKHSLSALSLCLLILTGCGNYEEFKEDPSAAFGNILPSTALSFETIKKEVLQENCIGCHSGYENYDNVLTDIEDIKREVIAGSMPKGSTLAQDKKVLLLSWIAGGAQRGVISIQPDPSDTDKLAPNYASINKNILQRSCTVCHNPQGEVPWLDFSSRVSLFSLRDQLFDFDDAPSSYIIEVITDPAEPMPPLDSPFDQLTDEEVEVFTEWIRLGLP
jgi:mono/diheme cytochrome c family protein